MTDTDLLRSIDASLKALVTHFGCGARPSSPTAQPDAPTGVSDADLDGKYGDPEVKAVDPRDWTGDTMKGKRFSQCPAAYLDLVASRLDFFIRKTTDQAATAANQDEREALQKKNHYQRLDAARARGWAARIRAGYVAPAAADSGSGFPSDEEAVF